MLDQVKRALLTTVTTNKMTTRSPRKAAKVNAELLNDKDKQDALRGVRG